MLHVLSLLAVLLVGAGPAVAQSTLPHTPAEERACRGDAHRLCKDVLSASQAEITRKFSIFSALPTTQNP